jgi:sugar/nucleoside kinase (ribokinase family)
MRLVVTAGARGSFAFDGCGWTHAPTLPVRVVSSAGAGDALLGGVLAGLAAGLPFAANTAHRATLAARPLASALDLGALVAAFKVTSPHTIPPDLSLDAVLDFAREHGVAFGEPFRRLLPADEGHRHAS